MKYEFSFDSEKEFMDYLHKLKEIAAAFGDFKPQPEILLQIRKIVAEVFRENEDLAYEIGVEHAMSYNDNVLRDIDNLTDAFRDEVPLHWVSSSWDEC